MVTNEQEQATATTTEGTTNEATKAPRSAIDWFEIPTIDLDRAARFWERTLGRPLRREVGGGDPMALFPYEGGVGGALVQRPGQRPASGSGVTVYLAALDIDATLARAEAAGGGVVMPRTEIPEGVIALIQDSEGNLVGLHAERLTT